MSLELQRLEQNGVPESFLMVHGTSAHALVELLRDGSLPTGVKDAQKPRPNDFTENRIYLTPNSYRFKRQFPSEKYRELSNRKSLALRNAKNYARFSGYKHHFASSVGCKTHGAYYLINLLECGSIGWKDFQEGMKKEGLDMSLS